MQHADFYTSKKGKAVWGVQSMIARLTAGRNIRSKPKSIEPQKMETYRANRDLLAPNGRIYRRKKANKET